MVARPAQTCRLARALSTLLLADSAVLGSSIDVYRRFGAPLGRSSLIESRLYVGSLSPLGGVFDQRT
eukprot:scaffold66707_cov103-Phaeocystis_antarctica.AAC.1